MDTRGAAACSTQPAAASPNDEELYALRRVWLDNEVLYREGLALQVDKGDPAIRERVIFKALSVVDAASSCRRSTTSMLRDWFEQHRDKYDEPARYDFQEAVLSGDTSEAAVRAFVADVERRHAGRRQGRAARVQGPAARQPRAELRRRVRHGARGSRRPASGARCTAATACAPMRSMPITPPKPASFEDLRGVVLQDWTDAVMAEQRSAAVRALAEEVHGQGRGRDADEPACCAACCCDARVAGDGRAAPRLTR